MRTVNDKTWTVKSNEKSDPLEEPPEDVNEPLERMSQWFIISPLENNKV